MGKRLRVDFAQRQGEVDPDILSRSTQLYVANINLCVNEQLLSAYFSQFGPVKHAIIVRQMGGVSKGFGFVEFEVPPSSCLISICNFPNYKCRLVLIWKWLLS